MLIVIVLGPSPRLEKGRNIFDAQFKQIRFSKVFRFFLTVSFELLFQRNGQATPRCGYSTDK